MDAKTFYEQIAPKLDPGGFKLYFTAKRMTGFDLYGQFPYEDARGMFEMMNGHQLMRYLLADQFHAVRWEIVNYALQRIRNILKQKIRRSSGLSQAGDLKEESASGIFKSLSSASI